MLTSAEAPRDRCSPSGNYNTRRAFVALVARNYSVPVIVGVSKDYAEEYGVPEKPLVPVEPELLSEYGERTVIAARAACAP